MIRKNQYTKPVVVCDLDGVFCDFTFSQTRLLKTMFGKPEYPLNTFSATSWGIEWLGLTQEHENIFWGEVTESEDPFWANEREIIPGVVERIWRLHEEYVIYFCTTRVDTKAGSARQQSAEFLSNNGYRDAHVVVSDKKGDFCKSVNATYFIDDKFDNCRQVKEKSPDTFVYFLALPHCTLADIDEARTSGMITITSVEDFLKMLEHKLEEMECCRAEFLKNIGR